jgi:hypothetical protein
MFRIQGQRAARSPLATFSTRLRRSDPGLGSRRASGARTLDQSNNASEPRRGDRRARLISVGPLGLELLCLGSRGSALRARPWLPSRRASGAQIRPTFSTRLRRSDPGSIQQCERAPEGRQTRAANFCRPVGPEIVMFRIQGQRATRSPLATFSTRLRRSDPGLPSRRAFGAQIRAFGAKNK